MHLSAIRTTRRMILRFSLPLLFLGMSSQALASETLRVLSWPGYVSSDAVRAFEARHQVQVEITEVGTDDELWSRVNSKTGTGFDVLAANTAELPRYRDAGLLIPLSLSEIPNIRKQLPRFRKLSAIPGLYRAGNAYAIPYTYSGMGLIYNRKLVKDLPHSMAALWEQRYKGQVLIYNGSAHNFSLTALIRGYKNPFQLNETQIAAVTQQLLRLRDNTPIFYNSPDEAVELFKSKPIALVFANYGDQQVAQLRRAGADIGYVIPDEGALAWMDCWAITKHSDNPKLAHAWINYMLSEEVSGQLSATQGLANTLRAPNKLPPKGKLIWLETVEDAAKRAQLWERLLSGAQRQR